MAKTPVYLTLDEAKADREARPLSGKRRRVVYECGREGETAYVVATNSVKARAAVAGHFGVVVRSTEPRAERPLLERVAEMTPEERAALRSRLDALDGAEPVANGRKGRRAK